MTGCASQSIFKSDHQASQVEEVDMGSGVYRVTVHGNENLSQDLVERELLRSMAEITLREGMAHFTIVAKNTICETTVRTSPTSTCTYTKSTDSDFVFTMLSDYMLEEVGEVTKEYETTALMLIGPGELTSNTTKNYVAADILSK